MSDNQKKQKKYKGFIFWENYVETMKEYPREYQDFLWLSIIRFMYFDENPDFNKIEDGMGRLAMRSVWTASLPYLEKSKSQFGNTNALKDNETKLKPSQNESETHRKEKENEDKEESVKKRTAFVPPSIDEVREYADSSGYAINAESFVSYYEAVGWMVGKNKMKNWQAAVRSWASREKQQNPQPQQRKTKVVSLDDLL